MKTKQGVSLIVLVITIIVMIILTGAIVLSLKDTSILERAHEAVRKTNESQLKSILELGWADAYAAGARTEEALKTSIDAVIQKNNLDVSDYDIVVTTSGVTITTIDGWRQKGLTVTNGKVTLTIGDRIAYDETNGGNITGLTDVEWAILGVNDSSELLIMSTTNIDKNPLYDRASTIQERQNTWLTGTNSLDQICEKYGKGNGAVGARSIRIEDINKVTGYNPQTAKYGKGEIYEYENEVTYSYNGTGYPSYKGNNGVTGTLSHSHSNGFHYYNGNEFVVLTNVTTGTSGTIFATLKNTGYSYDATVNNEEQKGIGSDTKAHEMLFSNASNGYWLASQYVSCKKYTVEYGFMFADSEGSINMRSLWDSDGSFPSGSQFDYMLLMTYGARAVVILSQDINLTGSSETGWTY